MIKSMMILILNLITPTIFNHLIIPKEWFLIPFIQLTGFLHIIPNTNMAVCVRRDPVWIGLHATSQGGDLHHFWPDCGQLTSYTDFNPWQSSSEDQKEGCVMFHPSSTYYSAVDCYSSLPYICENIEAGYYHTIL